MCGKREITRVKRTSGVHTLIVNGHPCTSFITVCVCNNSCAGLLPLPVSQFDTCLSFKSGKGFWNHITCLAVCVSAPAVNGQSKSLLFKQKETLKHRSSYSTRIMMRMHCTSNFKLSRSDLLYTFPQRLFCHGPEQHRVRPDPCKQGLQNGLLCFLSVVMQFYFGLE